MSRWLPVVVVVIAAAVGWLVATQLRPAPDPALSMSVADNHVIAAAAEARADREGVLSRSARRQARRPERRRPAAHRPVRARRSERARRPHRTRAARRSRQRPARVVPVAAPPPVRVTRSAAPASPPVVPAPSPRPAPRPVAIPTPRPARQPAPKSSPPASAPATEFDDSG
jgi:hypothetical protein